MINFTYLNMADILFVYGRHLVQVTAFFTFFTVDEGKKVDSRCCCSLLFMDEPCVT